MIAMILAAALAQSAPAAPAAPDPCNAAGQPATPRPGCPAWQPVRRAATSTNPEGDAGYMDPASVRRDGALVRVMVRLTMDPATDGIASVLALLRFDCAARTALIEHIAGYDESGRQLFQGAPEGEDANPRAAGPTAALIDDLCPPRQQ